MDRTSFGTPGNKPENWLDDTESLERRKAKVDMEQAQKILQDLEKKSDEGAELTDQEAVQGFDALCAMMTYPDPMFCR